MFHKTDQIQDILAQCTMRYKFIQMIFVQNYTLAYLYDDLSNILCRNCGAWWLHGIRPVVIILFVQLIVYPSWHTSGVLRYLILLVVLSMDKIFNR